MATAAPPDISQIRAELRRIISEVVGADLEDIDDETPLLDYVTSSLALLAGIRMVYDRYGVLVPLRPLLEGTGNLRALSALIDQTLHTQGGNLLELHEDETADQGPLVALAPFQQHRGFLARYSAGASAAFGEHIALRLSGPLHGPALRAALEAVVARHEAARAVLSTTDAGIRLSARRFELPISHVTGEIDRHVASICSRPFNPGDRLFRAELLRAGEADHTIVVVGHGLAFDHEALLTILGDIAAFYNVFARNDGSQYTPPVAAQLTQYMDRRRPTADDTARAAAEDFWKAMLADGPPPLQLPSDHSRPAVKGYAGARLSVPIPEDVSAKLLEWPELPPSTVVLGAFSAFLHRLAGQKDIVVGAGSAPVGLNGEGQIVAPTREVLPIRSDYDPQRSFAAHVRRASNRLTEANNHRPLSLAEIINLLKVPRDQSRSPLFSAAFRSEAYDRLPSFDALRVAIAAIPIEHVRYDIEMTLVASTGSMELRCDYSTELFEHTTISAWMAGFLEFLRAGLEAPETACGMLPIISDEARGILLDRWNDTTKPAPPSPTVFDAIAEQARRNPARIAVRSLQREVSYGELMADAGRIAAMLHSHGVRRGSRVAIVLRRSPALVAAMLGTWQAGAAYVPIDPDLPKKRVSFMLADAGVEAIIATRELADLIDPTSGAHRLFLDEDQALPTAACPALDSLAREDSAYVIYTSGSTGQPKGVEIAHGSLLNCLISIRELVGFSQDHSLLALTTPSFDISTVELFVPLIAGGLLELAEDGLLMDGIALADRIVRCKPSFVQATPSTWKMLIDAGWSGDRDLIIASAGEALGRKLAEQLLTRGGTLWNFYGPTETTVFSTASKVQSDPEQPIRIGRPLRNTSLYILDELQQPVPIGATGDLYIGGEGLARQYVGRPELTRERFVPNPFRPGETLYRTGDVARYLPDGDVICLGRVDHQVKIHGYRVELGEIEAHLQAIAGVRDAAATTWIDRTGDTQLVAHILSDGDAAATPAQLRDRLREVLPEAMIPSFFLFHHAFPLTASGKVDRGALPQPDPGKGAVSAGAPPTSETERLLVQAWAKVLGISAERIGRDSDFMDLGGHSLLMTQLMVGSPGTELEFAL